MANDLIIGDDPTTRIRCRRIVRSRYSGTPPRVESDQGAGTTQERPLCAEPQLRPATRDGHIPPSTRVSPRFNNPDAQVGELTNTLLTTRIEVTAVGAACAIVVGHGSVRRQRPERVEETHPDRLRCSRGVIASVAEQGDVESIALRTRDISQLSDVDTLEEVDQPCEIEQRLAVTGSGGHDPPAGARRSLDRGRPKSSLPDARVAGHDKRSRNVLRTEEGAHGGELALPADQPGAASRGRRVLGQLGRDRPGFVARQRQVRRPPPVSVFNLPRRPDRTPEYSTDLRLPSTGSATQAVRCYSPHWWGARRHPRVCRRSSKEV